MHRKQLLKPGPRYLEASPEQQKLLGTLKLNSVQLRSASAVVRKTAKKPQCCPISGTTWRDDTLSRTGQVLMIPKWWWDMVSMDGKLWTWHPSVHQFWADNSSVPTGWCKRRTLRFSRRSGCGRLRDAEPRQSQLQTQQLLLLSRGDHSIVKCWMEPNELCPK